MHPKAELLLTSKIAPCAPARLLSQIHKRYPSPLERSCLTPTLKPLPACFTSHKTPKPNHSTSPTPRLRSPPRYQIGPGTARLRLSLSLTDRSTSSDPSGARKVSATPFARLSRNPVCIVSPCSHRRAQDLNASRASLWWLTPPVPLTRSTARPGSRVPPPGARGRRDRGQ